MIHLFKKVYIETDQKLDVDENRIVISETTGYSVSSNFEEAFIGKLYYCAENFESMLKNFGAEEIAEKNKPENQIDSGNAIIVKEDKELFDDFFAFLDFVDKCYEEIQEPLYIHVDQKAFNFFMVHWYKILFLNITFESLSSLLKSYIFLNKIFGSMGNSKARSSEFDLIFDEENLRSLFNEITLEEQKCENFVVKNKKHLSLEFLLSSYYYNKSCLEELITPVSNILKKNIESELYEVKEKVYIHLNSRNFLTQMNLNESYDFNNIENITKDDNSLSILFDTDIWKKTNSIIEGSSKGTINFSNIDDDKIEKFLRIRYAIELSQEEYDNYVATGFFKSTRDIFSSIKYFRKNELLTQEDLEEVLKKDTENIKSFFHTLTVPINFYFLDYLIKSKNSNNLENLEKFVLR